MRRAVLYLRVSTIDQTTANQERDLREIAGRTGCEIVKVYKGHGITGTLVGVSSGIQRKPRWARGVELGDFQIQH
jgi:DNA invertase Pin-like site-specific DNA recombinase